MPTKKEQILNLSDAMSAAEIAEELDTTASYVYKVRSAAEDTEGNSEPSATTSEGATEETENSEPSEDLNLGDSESEERDLPDGDTDREEVQNEQSEDLELTDSGGKEYECGECGATLEYLQKSCECGAKPAWSAIAK